MSDDFLKWLLRVWLTGLVIATFEWLWRHFPVGLVVLAVAALLLLRSVFQEKLRRRRQGYRVQYLSPGIVRAGDDDFAIAYHEGDDWHFFHGRICREHPWILEVPDQAAWSAQVPDWMRDKRRVVLDRLFQETARWRLSKRIRVVEVSAHASVFED